MQQFGKTSRSVNSTPDFPSAQKTDQLVKWSSACTKSHTSSLLQSLPTSNDDLIPRLSRHTVPEQNAAWLSNPSYPLSTKLCASRKAAEQRLFWGHSINELERRPRSSGLASSESRHNDIESHSGIYREIFPWPNRCTHLVFCRCNASNPAAAHTLGLCLACNEAVPDSSACKWAPACLSKLT